MESEMCLRCTRGKVLLKRDPLETTFAGDGKSAVAASLIRHPEWERQTWRGVVVAVGAAPYLVRVVSDGQDSEGVPRFRERIKTRDGVPLTARREIRKGDVCVWPVACPGSVEVIIAGERYVFVPIEEVLYVAEAAA